MGWCDFHVNLGLYLTDMYQIWSLIDNIRAQWDEPYQIGVKISLGLHTIFKFSLDEKHN
jgi:hypothetical protein